MFVTYDSVIDTIQNTKKSIVNTYVVEDKLRKPLIAFVDTQTAFTKQIFKSFEDVSTFLAEQTQKAFNIKTR